MTPEQELYQQALTAIHSGDFVKARELLSRLLKTDRKNVDYWLWMSTVVESQKDRVYCLREVLAIDPENQDAALGLRIMGEKAPALTHPIPIDQLRTAWKTPMELADELPHVSKGMRSRVVFYTILGVAIIGVFGVGVILAMNSRNQAQQGEIVRFTITPPPTSTLTLTPTVTATGLAPLSIELDVTFTPTPMYVATPHNRLEAYNTALRAYDKGDWAKAEEYFKQVLVDEPNSADVYYHLGDVYRFEGKYTEAMSAYNQGIKLDANFAPSYLGKGQIYLAQSPVKLEEALQNFSKAVELDPAYDEAYMQLAETSLKLNDPAGALTWLQKVGPDTANTARAELVRAQAYLLTGENQKALDSIQKARQLDRSLLPIYKVWAKALQLTGKYQESIQPLLTVIDKTPADFEAQALLAQAYYEIGDSDKAYSLLSSVIKQNSKSVEAYLLRAEIYLKQGKIDEASDDYNSVLRIDYNNFDANLGKGRVLLAQTLAGAAYNAFDYTEKFADTDAQKAELLYWRAKALIVLDQPGAAVSKFQEALAYPGVVLPPDLREDAESQLETLYTPTPTERPTLTPTPGKTLTPGRTATPTP